MQAIVLCGGRGERLTPLTNSTPKPLIPLRGRPIVDYAIGLLAKYGVTDIIIAAGYKSQKFHEHFGAHPHVRVVDSGDVDIIERLRSCAPLIHGDFLVLYGDTVSDVDLASLVRFHRARDQKATVTAWPLRIQFGLMELNAKGMVTSFMEKPQLGKWINIGHFCFSYEAISSFDGFHRYQDFLCQLVEDGELNAYRHTGVHITINTRKELEEAEEVIGREWEKFRELATARGRN